MGDIRSINGKVLVQLSASVCSSKGLSSWQYGDNKVSIIFCHVCFFCSHTAKMLILHKHVQGWEALLVWHDHTHGSHLYYDMTTYMIATFSMTWPHIWELLLVWHDHTHGSHLYYNMTTHMGATFSMTWPHTWEPLLVWHDHTHGSHF